MPEFAYTARDAAGQKVTGTLSATNAKEVAAMLSGRALFPVHVAASEPVRGIGSSRRVGGQVMAVTYSQLASLLRAGVPMLRSLAVLRDQTSHKTLKAVLTDVYEHVEQGSTLAEAMGRHPKVFSEMALNMVRAGGEGGFLEDALVRVAQFTEQQEDLKSRTIGALAYPAFLATVGTSIVAFLIIFFVPRFAIMFDRLRQKNELPIMTDWLLGFSQFLQHWGWILALGAIVAWILVRAQLQTPEGRRKSDLLKIRLPLFGDIFQSLAVARFCRVLGTMLHNGVPILKALEISRDAAGNRILSAAIAEASENISAGESLAQPLMASKHFPRPVVEMIAVAEESNTLDTVLVDIADGLERRTGRKLDLAVRLLEPIMLLLLAGVVLFVVIALLLPVIKMSSTL